MTEAPAAYGNILPTSQPDTNTPLERVFAAAGCRTQAELAAFLGMLRQIESICLYAEDTPQCSFRIQTAKTLNVRRTFRGVHAGCRQNPSRPTYLAHRHARLRMHLLKPLRPPRFSFH